MPGKDVIMTPPARDLVPAAAGPEVERLAAAAAAYADANMASNTRRAYDSDWADFSAWCSSVAASPMPAAAATVALYLTHGAEKGLTVATLERRMAAIRTAHRMEDLPLPASRELRAIWGGIRRTHGRPPRQKRAIITEDLRRIVARLPANTIGVRDRALILITYAAALRRSEVAAMVVQAGAPNRSLRLQFVSGGAQVAIDHSKADQEGHGAVVSVPYGRTKLCPILAVQAWLELAQIHTGPVFRPVDRHGRIAQRAMSEKAIADVVKRAAKRAKIDPATIGGHSLRSGLVTQAIINDVAVPVIMKQTRHAKVDTLNKYIRMADGMSKSAGGKVGL